MNPKKRDEAKWEPAPFPLLRGKTLQDTGTIWKAHFFILTLFFPYTLLPLQLHV